VMQLRWRLLRLNPPDCVLYKMEMMASW
jgi:hypothetical protein